VRVEDARYCRDLFDYDIPTSSIRDSLSSMNKRLDRLNDQFVDTLITPSVAALEAEFAVVNVTLP